MSQSITVIV